MSDDLKALVERISARAADVRPVPEPEPAPESPRAEGLADPEVAAILDDLHMRRFGQPRIPAGVPAGGQFAGGPTIPVYVHVPHELTVKDTEDEPEEDEAADEQPEAATD